MRRRGAERVRVSCWKRTANWNFSTSRERIADGEARARPLQRSSRSSFGPLNAKLFVAAQNGKMRDERRYSIEAGSQSVIA
ncbi:hypothetical protein CBOM_03292 [Ceraceosorus bombacis]|uniref:Uncharacterized protein n=1 Tax=Ceraceosorus bombacis TaxID=401625 RepID=A0A0P1BMN9_9BASI|nr:hypothetical protein CBOM_03292 [Ceraceosorus bombacis]